MELDEESASSRAESSLSDAWPFAVGAVVCELGKDVDAFGAAAAAEGFEPLDFEASGTATGADVVSVRVLSGSVGRPWKCAHPA